MVWASGAVGSSGQCAACLLTRLQMHGAIVEHCTPVWGAHRHHEQLFRNRLSNALTALLTGMAATSSALSCPPVRRLSSKRFLAGVNASSMVGALLNPSWGMSFLKSSLAVAK